jgi:hypothetical protein
MMTDIRASRSSFASCFVSTGGKGRRGWIGTVWVYNPSFMACINVTNTLGCASLIFHKLRCPVQATGMCNSHTRSMIQQYGPLTCSWVYFTSRSLRLSSDNLILCANWINPMISAGRLSCLIVPFGSFSFKNAKHPLTRSPLPNVLFSTPLLPSPICCARGLLTVMALQSYFEPGI